MTDETTVQVLRRTYSAALLVGDEIAAEAAIRDALDANLTSGEIDEQIIAPALWLVGEMWQRGDLTAADEHLATEISLRVLALQHEAQRVMFERPEHRVMLATSAGEEHVVALRMVANLLRGAGYDVVMLGADLPIDQLAAAARRLRPDVICLSATMPGGADQVLVAIHEIQQNWPAAGFVIGGRDLAARLRSRPGIDVCDHVSQAVESVDAMVKRASLN